MFSGANGDRRVWRIGGFGRRSDRELFAAAGEFPGSFSSGHSQRQRA